MKKILIFGFLVFQLNSLFSQRDIIKDNSSVVQIKTTQSVSDEVINKYGKGSSIAEYLIIKIREFEEINNVKVLSKEEFDENLKMIKQLKNELQKETNSVNKKSIGKKIAYIQNRRVNYESIEAELLR